MADAKNAAVRLDSALPREHRAFERFRNPSLVVELADRMFATVDWSVGGALLSEVENHGWRCGQSIDVKVGLATGQRLADQMVIVRYSPETKHLAVRARSLSSALTQVKQACDIAGITVR